MADDVAIKPPAGDAFVLQGSQKGLEVRASEGGLQQIADTGERLWYFSLNWVGAHPVIFVCVLVFMLIWAWQVRLTKVQTNRDKLEYDAARSRARSSAPKSRRVK